MKDQSRAYLLAILAILFWSTMSSAFKISLRFISPVNLLLYAAFFSIIVLFSILVFQNKLSLLKTLSRRDLLNSALMGFLNPFLYYVVLFEAYSLLRAQEAGTLNYIWPLVLVLLSVPLLKQKIGWMSILAVFVSFFGIIIISTHGNIFALDFSSPLGVLLAVGSAVFWALFWIFNMRDKREEVSKIFLNIVFGFAYILILVLILGEFALPSPEALLGAFYIGSFEMGITFVLWLRALKLSSDTAKVSNLVYLSPFIALIFIRYAVGEMILLSTVVGLGFIVAGILLQKYSEKLISGREN